MSDVIVAGMVRSCLRFFVSMRWRTPRVTLPRASRLTRSSEPRRSAPAEDRPSGPVDPAFSRVMLFVFVATRGGTNRVRVVRALREEPMNANRLGERLGLDYKTVQHHLSVLEENAVLVRSPPRGASGGYGAVYFLSPHFERHMDQLEAMWAQSGKK